MHAGEVDRELDLLKEGEEEFIRQAKLVRRYGAAVIVMAFDEKGQADTLPRRIEICERAYRILTEKVGFPPQDIIFDPNIFPVATGMDEHRRNALDYFEATRWIKRHLPHAKISGGVSNVSFSFRGNDRVREAIHAAFLYHGIQAGMDMGIVNPAQLQVYDEIPKDLLELVEDVLLDRRDDATERLIAHAETLKGTGLQKEEKEEAWRQGSVEDRLAHALVKGWSISSNRTWKKRSEVSAAAATHRRSAHGGHEHRRRPVRCRQDVSPAGRQERTRDEEGCRVSATTHQRGRRG